MPSKLVMFCLKPLLQTPKARIRKLEFSLQLLLSLLKESSAKSAVISALPGFQPVYKNRCTNTNFSRTNIFKDNQCQLKKNL